MGLAREQEVELVKPPLFDPGEKVVSTKYIKNDGTYPRREIGDILVAKGDVGYVRDVGSFLQQFYVYAVEFVDRGVVVGMRGKELRTFADWTSSQAAKRAASSRAEGVAP
jgi:nitrogen fixation protein NifZ